MYTCFRTTCFIPLGLALLALLPGCSDDPAYGSDYDIRWPVSTAAAIAPADSALVSSAITLSGTELDKVTTITIDNRTMTIVNQTATTLTATLPRKFNASAITLTNLYRQTFLTTQKIAPKYPAVQVTSFPTIITKGQPIVLTGSNLDLVTSILIGSNVVAVASTDAATLTVQTADLKINPGDNIVLEVRSTYAKVVNNKSGEIDVVE